MDSECPICGTRIVGMSCYKCGWPEANCRMDTSAEATSYGSYGDAVAGDPFAPPRTSDRGGTSYGSAASYEDDLAGSQPYASYPSGNSTEISRIVEGEFSSSPAHSGGSSGGVPSSGHSLTGSNMVPRGDGNGLIAGMFEKDSLFGTVEYVSDTAYETNNLTAHYAAQQLAIGCLLAPFKAMGLILGLLFRPFRFLLGVSLMGGRGRGGPESVQTEIHRFRIRCAGSNRLIECVLRGQLAGGGIYLGEDVELTGKFDSRTGTFAVERLVNASTGAVTTGIVDPQVKYQRAALAASLTMVLFAILFLMSVLT